ncbi:MAG: hypothetical protein WBN31_05710, partial [Gammaproteobacteria bacterium]
DNLRRIDIDVAYADDPDTILGQATGFLSPPATQRASGGWGGTGFDPGGNSSGNDTNTESGEDGQ